MAIKINLTIACGHVMSIEEGHLIPFMCPDCSLKENKRSSRETQEYEDQLHGPHNVMAVYAACGHVTQSPNGYVPNLCKDCYDKLNHKEIQAAQQEINKLFVDQDPRPDLSSDEWFRKKMLGMF